MFNNIDIIKLEQFAKEVDVHLKKLTDFTDALKSVRDAMIDVTKVMQQNHELEIRSMKQELDTLSERLERVGLPKIDVYERKIKFIKEKLESNDWPIATEFINTDDEAETQKSNNILELLVTEYLQGVKFLDFGCGKGFTTNISSHKGTKLSVGYDIKSNWNFSNTNKLIYTTDWELVKSQGPYDVILLYDVMDHLEGDIIGTLKNIKDVMVPNGKVYIRNHPWSSVHGAHLHTQINKAFLHLVLDEVELTRIGGFHYNFVHKLKNPIQHYREWIARSGLLVKDETIITESVDSFFTKNENLILLEKIKHQWGHDNPIKDMEIMFVDYVLECPPNLNQQIF